MSNDVLVLAERVGDDLLDTSFELLAKAVELAHATGGRAEVLVLGSAAAAQRLTAADTVLVLDHPSLREYLPEAYEKALLHVLTERAPRLLLLPNSTVGLDLAASVAELWDAPLAASVVALQPDGDGLVATCQILGGKVLAEVTLDGERGICTVVGGSFDGAAAHAAAHAGGSGAVVALAGPDSLGESRMSVLEVLEPDGDDVDITSAELLVSVGRGVGSADNLELVQELAQALGVPLAASRPIIDSGWLPKARQVGKSGLTVKPKVYLAFGISGAPEHLEGIRGAELVIACNTDPKAPLFDVAHYGTTEDLFDLVPALTDRLAP